MRLLICAAVAALTVLSFTTAAVLPTRGEFLSKLEVLLSNGAVPQSDEYDQFGRLFAISVLGVTYGVADGFDAAYNLTKSTEGFNASVVNEIGKAVSDANGNLGIMIYRYIVDEMEYDGPMDEVATGFQKFTANVTETVATGQRRIMGLVKEENLLLSLRVQLIFTLADATTTAALAPTVLYLHQFLPSH